MGVVTGLLLGAGLCLVLWAVTSPPPPRRVRSRWSADLAALLTALGSSSFRSVTPSAWITVVLAALGGVGVVVLPNVDRRPDSVVNVYGSLSAPGVATAIKLASEH